MKVVLIKPYMMGKIEKKAGTQFDCTKEFGTQLINEGYAEALQGYTQDEIEFATKVSEMYETEETEQVTKKVKKATKAKEK